MCGNLYTIHFIYGVERNHPGFSFFDIHCSFRSNIACRMLMSLTHVLVIIQQLFCKSVGSNKLMQIFEGGIL